MRRPLECLLGVSIMIALSGCGQGSAAPLAAAPVPPPQPIKLEPNVVHVPAAPKLPAPDAKKDSAAALPATKAAQDTKPADSKPIVASERPADRGDRGDRGDRRPRRMGAFEAPREGRAMDAGGRTVLSAPPREVPKADAPAAPAGGGSIADSEGTPISFGGPPPGGDVGRSTKKGFVPSSGLPDWFAKLDADGDGQIALHEWPADRSMEEFAKYDLNGDGFITPQEVLRVLGPPKTVASNESNTGGTATPPPSNGAPPAAPPGSNGQPPTPPGNAVVSNDGSGRFTITMNPGGPPDRGPGGDPNRQRYGGRGGFNQSPEERLQRTKDFISRYDTNKDGKLSLDELPPNFAFLRDRFAEFDTNKDGVLDPQELQNAFDAMRRSWGGGR